ncbi:MULTISPECIES: SusC/RagA family TonB-linked outer membrane protein [unclassified Saccharicrinis]|uniref:SusC/RagA family TonB-linked outer membrane protein n=1 Tax=unclassified Saccharicrinis TaxID=2646859 RepID=UPI003D33616A
MHLIETMGFSRKKLNKPLLVMKLIFMLMVVCSVQLTASVYSQNTRLNIEISNQSLEDVLKEIRNKSEFTFVYDLEDVEGVWLEEANYKGATVEEILNDCLRNTTLTYEVIDKVVILKQTSPKTVVAQQEPEKVTISGKVTDETGGAIPGVTVYVKGTSAGTVTDANGNYSLLIPNAKVSVSFSFIGFVNQEIEVEGSQSLDVRLVKDVQEVDEVVVTGIVQIRKESFTGTATIVEADELMSMGTDNVIRSLVLLDPALNIVDNNVFGSDPNVLPEIRLRGDAILSATDPEFDVTSFSSDPNAPIFILDDFETTLTKVIDMDMNRIESITILKDAAATAMYGSRAANGVIVIKTKQPEAGKVKVSYNLNTVISLPDLDSYDLLNAEELFGLQKDLGLFNYFHDSDNGLHKITAIEKNIAKGVNTDWMAQPTRNAFGQKHSLNFMGGDEYIRYMLDVNYSDKPGVMKGSDRKNYGIALTLNYNLKNKLILKNRIAVDKNNAENSPYGSFDYYAKMPGYLPIQYSNGQLIERYVIPVYDTEDYSYFSNYNPVYEAGVGNSDHTKYMDINNNFSLEWRIVSGLKLKANISYTNNNYKNKVFVSPDSYKYWSTSNPERKGLFTFSDVVSESIYGNAILSYMKEIKKHFINASLAYNVSSKTSELLGFSAQGFAASKYNNPAFANSYAVGGVPPASEQTVRLIGGLASVNYTFDNRFLADLTYRLDGSSQFGANDKTAGFYSFGLGWNIHKEKFLRNNDVISRFKIKGTYGETGSVNFSAYQAKDVLQYYTDVRYLGGLGTYLAALGNENLSWQTTTTLDLGVEFGFFANKISGSFNYYDKNTSDMIMDITTPPSIGFDSFKENLGEMENKGFEFALRAKLINKAKFKWNVYWSGYQNKSKILGIGNSLKYYNELSNQAGLTDAEIQAYEESYGSADDFIMESSHNFYVRFEEGRSNTAIYAVRSLGIDPMTGKEIFLTKDGVPTFDWDAKDKVVVGDSEAKLRGSFGTDVAYGPLEIGFMFSYSTGGQKYNQTLVNKVENSNKYYNVDRRVLEETWMEPGDVVKYKNNVLSWGNMSYTPASDRFVQDYSYLNLSSVNMNYHIPEHFYNKIGIESLRLTFNMGDVFNWSTVKMERGTSYPYARSFTIGLRANF